MSILRAGRASPIALRKTKSHGGLPVPEVHFLRSLPRFFYGSLQLAIKFQLRNFAAHWRQQSKVTGMGLPGFIAEDVPSCLVNPERREPNRALSQRIKEELAKAVAAASF